MKKLVSLFLVFVMIFSLLPLSALAAEDVQTETEQSLETEGSVGTLLGNTLDGAGVMDDEPSACSVTDISVEGKTATVDYQTDRASELVVAIYEESTNKMLGSGHTIVSADADMATVTIEIETMPAYYIVSAYLLEAETLVPLCDAFTSTYYTQEVSELRQKTAEDFEEERVLLLEDGNTETNFLVLSEDTLVTEETGDENQITDNGDGTYTITNADESFLSLQEGGSFSYTYADGTVLLVVAKAVTVSGTTVTVTADTDAELADMFDYVKIEATSDGAEPVVDTSTMGEGITYMGYDENTTVPMDGALIDEKVSVGHEFNFALETKPYESTDEKKEVTLSGTFTLSIKVTLEMYIALDYQYVELGIKFTSAIKAEVSGKLTAWEESLGGITLPLVNGVASFKLEPKLVLEFSAAISLSVEQSVSYGFSYDTNSGFQSKNSEPKTESKFEFEGEVFFGLKIKAALVVGNTMLKKLLGDDLAEAYVSGTAGLRLKLSQDYWEEKDDERHLCDSCLEGEINKVMSAEIGLKILEVVKLTYSPLKTEKKLCDAYFSLSFQEFGFTTCPHKSYCVTVNVAEGDDPVVGAEISVVNKKNGASLTFDNDENITDKEGTANVFLPNGVYTFTARYQEKEKVKDITVRNKATTTSLDLAVSVEGGTSVGPTEEDDEIIDSGFCGEKVTWKLYSNGELVVLGSGKMEDYPTDINKYPPWLYCLTKIEEVTIEEGVKNIGLSSFIGCEKIKKITIANSVESIGDGAFALCKALESVTIPSGVTSIGEVTFSDCSALESVTIPSSVTSIERGAFSNCTALKDIYYTGTQAQWKAIKIDDNNTPLTSATIHYNYNPTTAVTLDGAVEETSEETTEEVTKEETTTEEVTEETTEEVTTEETTAETTTEEVTEEATTEETTTEEGTIELVAAYTGVLSEANGQKLAGFTDLVPSARHVLLVMKDANASDPLAVSNLLYIVQGKSSATGALSLVYVPRETVSNPAAVVYGPDKATLSEAAVMVGKKPVGIVTVKVTLDGSVLTEDVDYTFTSSTDANGVTTVTVTGKGAYSGTAEATLRREPGDVDGNGKTDIMDVLALLKSVAGITAMPEHGDVNVDGETTIMDVLALLKYVAGIAGSVVY